MSMNGQVRRMMSLVDPSGSIVTITLDLSGSARLPPETRVFLKTQVKQVLGAAGLAKLYRRVRGYVEKEALPGTQGIFLLAGSSAWQALPLPVRLRNFVVQGRSAYVAPLLAAASRAPQVYVVRADPWQAWIEELNLWGSRLLKTLDAPERSDQAPGSRSAGLPGRGGAERDLRQRRDAERVHGLLRQAATEVARQHRIAPGARIYFIGRKEFFKAFHEALPDLLQDRCVYGGPRVKKEMGLPAGIRRDLERRASGEVEGEVLGFDQGRAQGLRVALGPGDVLEHLSLGALSRVYLDPEDPVPGKACSNCGTLSPGPVARCPFCSGEVRDTSITQEVVSHAFIHPQVQLTFLPPGTQWLRDLGGMAGLLATKGAGRPVAGARI